MFFRASTWPCRDLAAAQHHRPKVILFLQPLSRTLASRAFSQARGLAARAKRQQPTKAVPYESKVAEYENAAKKLARNTGPTLLYQAQNNFPYVLGCYFVGGVLLGCAAINNITKEASLTANVPAWVPAGVAIGQFMMVGFGSWWLLKVRSAMTSGLVRIDELISNFSPKIL